MLEPIQARYRELIDDRGELARLLAQRVADKARAVASATLHGCTTPSACSRPDATHPSTPAHGRRPADSRAGAPGTGLAGRRAGLRARRHGDRRAARHRAARRSGSRQRRCCRSSSPVPTSSPTAPPNASPVGSAPATRRRRQRRGAGHVAVGVLRCPGRSPAVFRRQVAVGRPRCLRRGARSRRDLPEHQCPRRAVLPGHLAAQGVLRGASDYITPLWVLFGANVANLVIELVLVFVLDMGVAGSALSTVVAQIGAGARVRPRSCGRACERHRSDGLIVPGCAP